MFGPARRVPVRAVGHVGPSPHMLGPADEDKDYRLEPPSRCVYCGHLTDAAYVARIEEGQYAYACHACSIRDPGDMMHT